MHRHNRALKDDIVEHSWRVAFTTVAVTFLLFHLAIKGVGMGWLGALCLAGVLFLFVVIEHEAGALLRRHVGRWASATVRYRRVRVSAPYDRLPPVATASCSVCGAIPGQRHDRACATIPAAWFSDPRTRGVRQR